MLCYICTYLSLRPFKYCRLIICHINDCFYPYHDLFIWLVITYYAHNLYIFPGDQNLQRAAPERADFHPDRRQLRQRAHADSGQDQDDADLSADGEGQVPREGSGAAEVKGED